MEISVSCNFYVNIRLICGRRNDFAYKCILIAISSLLRCVWCENVLVGSKNVVKGRKKIKNSA